jgi:hypothetical protein
VAADDGSAEYRRRARHLRCHFAGQPATLHSALDELAREQDSRRGTWKNGPSGDWGHPAQRAAMSRPDCTGDPVLSSVLGVASASAEYLARLVEQSLSDGVLPYARRQDVLRAARRLGVGRFQANLLIAAVQHRCERATPQPEPPRQRLPWGFVGCVALVVAFEAALALCAISIAHI